MVAAVAGAPESATPIEAVAAGLEAAASLLGERRQFARQRQSIIAASPELREREVMKLASLSAALAEALRARGVEGSAASLTSEVAIGRLSDRVRTVGAGGQQARAIRADARDARRADGSDRVGSRTTLTAGAR